MTTSAHSARSSEAVWSMLRADESEMRCSISNKEDSLIQALSYEEMQSLTLVQELEWSRTFSGRG